jgi:hypothetical protein
MINVTGALLVVLAILALLFVSSVNEGFANEVSSSYGDFITEGFSASIGPSNNNVYVSWPGGVVSPPPYSVTAGSDTGYHW